MNETTKQDSNAEAAGLNERLVMLASKITMIPPRTLNNVARLELKILALKNKYSEEHFDKAAQLAECTVNNIFDWIELTPDELDNALQLYGA